MKEMQLYHSSTTGFYYLMGVRMYKFYNTLTHKWEWGHSHKSALRHIELKLIGNNFRLK